MNKRQSRRKKVSFPVEVKAEKLYSRRSFKVKGEVIDIGEGGLGLYLERPLPFSPDLVYMDLEPEHPRLETRIQMIWGHSSFKRKGFRCGVKFVELDAKQAATLKEVLERVEDKRGKKKVSPLKKKRRTKKKG